MRDLSKLDKSKRLEYLAKVLFKSKLHLDTTKPILDTFFRESKGYAVENLMRHATTPAKRIKVAAILKAAQFGYAAIADHLKKHGFTHDDVKSSMQNAGFSHEQIKVGLAFAGFNKRERAVA